MARRNLLIKPASGACNMRCDYCFYKDEQENRDVKSYGMMDIATSHALIDRALESPIDSCTFAFQGGEPTLRGLDFFRDFVSCAESKGKDRVSFSIQTNGFAVDKEWAEFFKAHNFLVGLSMDGNRKIHDKYRHTPNGEDSFKRVYRSSQYLKSSKVDFNILITVTEDVAENVKEINDFFIRNDFRYLQYIPCIDPIETDRGDMHYSLSAKTYGVFLKKLFDIYHEAWLNGKYFSIRYFDNLVMMLAGEPPEACGMAGVCSANYVVEADGSVFPCDFYVLDGYRLGNINTDSFSDMDKERSRIGFIEKSLVIADACKTCRFYPICRGGCRRDREDFSSDTIGLTYLCPAYKDFFRYALDKLIYMGKTEAAARKGDAL